MSPGKKDSANNNAESLSRPGRKVGNRPSTNTMNKDEKTIDDIDPNANAYFTNFSEEPFTGYWDGKPRTFKAKEGKWMPAWLAIHFAKTLANKVLVARSPNGDLIHPKGDTMTSPKFPEQVPLFMEFFNKAFTLSPEDKKAEEKKTDLDSIIDSSNKNKEVEKEKPAPKPKEEEEFEGKPQENLT